MYQVIKLYGDFEPWWFLEDWKDDMIASETFHHFDEAAAYYQEVLKQLKAEFPSFESRPNYLATFWDKDEQRWCEECDEYLQQYHSVALLQDDQVLPVEKHDMKLEEANDQPKQPSACALR